MANAIPAILADPSLDRTVLRKRPWFEEQGFASTSTFNRCVRAGQLPDRRHLSTYYWSIDEVMAALADPAGRSKDVLQQWAEAEAADSPPASPEVAAVVRSEFAAAAAGVGGGAS